MIQSKSSINLSTEISRFRIMLLRVPRAKSLCVGIVTILTTSDLPYVLWLPLCLKKEYPRPRTTLSTISQCSTGSLADKRNLNVHQLTRIGCLIWNIPSATFALPSIFFKRVVQAGSRYVRLDKKFQGFQKHFLSMLQGLSLTREIESWRPSNINTLFNPKLNRNLNIDALIFHRSIIAERENLGEQGFANIIDNFHINIKMQLVRGSN